MARHYDVTRGGRWPRHPSRARPHPTLGPRQTWTRLDGRARVERFVHGSGAYIAMLLDVTMPDGVQVPWRLLGGKPSLIRAMAACDRALPPAASVAAYERIRAAVLPQDGPD